MGRRKERKKHCEPCVQCSLNIEAHRYVLRCHKVKYTVVNMYQFRATLISLHAQQCRICVFPIFHYHFHYYWVLSSELGKTLSAEQQNLLLFISLSLFLIDLCDGWFSMNYAQIIMCSIHFNSTSIQSAKVYKKTVQVPNNEIFFLCVSIGSNNNNNNKNWINFWSSA